MQISLWRKPVDREYTLDTDHSPSEGEALWCCEVKPNGAIEFQWTYVKLGSDILGKPPGPIKSIMTKRQEGFRYLDTWVTENLVLVTHLLREAGHPIDNKYTRVPPNPDQRKYNSHEWNEKWREGGS